MAYPIGSTAGKLDLRASDAEREAVIERLRDHCADGRISTDELSQRLGAVYAARTRGDLEPPLRDLPTATGDTDAAADTRRRSSPSLAVASVPLLAIAAVVVAAAASGAWWLLWLLWPLLHGPGRWNRPRRDDRRRRTLQESAA